MFIIWHDKDYDLGRWVYLNSILSELDEEVFLRPIPKDNTKNILLRSLTEKFDHYILPIIKYETPDIIIQRIDDDRGKSIILLATEFMTHTPQHHHPLQRFSRIYTASKLGVPVSLVIPRAKIKLERGTRDTYSPRRYTTNPLIYHIFLKSTYINATPTLIFLWPEKNGYLKYDKRHPTAPFIDDQIARWFYFLDTSIKSYNNLLQDGEISNQLSLMRNISNYTERNLNDFIANYKTLYKLKTIKVIDTKDAIKKFSLEKDKLGNVFLKNKKTAIFAPEGLHAPSSPFRTDPYGGMLCAFDNLFCRDKKGERVINLVFRAKNIMYSVVSAPRSRGPPQFRKIEHDVENCPFISFKNCEELSIDDIKEHLDNCPFTGSKQQRIYGDVPDVVVFDDYVYYKSKGG